MSEEIGTNQQTTQHTLSKGVLSLNESKGAELIKQMMTVKTTVVILYPEVTLVRPMSQSS